MFESNLSKSVRKCDHNNYRVNTTVVWYEPVKHYLGGQDISADFTVVGLDTSTTVVLLVVHVCYGNFLITAESHLILGFKIVKLTRNPSCQAKRIV